MNPPRGVILTKLLSMLKKRKADLNIRSLVRQLRQRVKDPGLDGCLLEMEIVWTLKEGAGIAVEVLSRQGGDWERSGHVMTIPPKGKEFNVGVCDNENEIVCAEAKESASWWVIELPAGFPVIDIVAVDNEKREKPVVYGIQVTRSEDPFLKHYTTDTCPKDIKPRLGGLLEGMRRSRIVSREVKVEEMVYVMWAPNCTPATLRLPVDHKNAFWIGPLEVLQIQAGAPLKTKKRKRQSGAQK